MTTAQQEVSSLLKVFFFRKETVPPDKWVESEIRLTSRQSVHQGLYSLKRTPFFRQIYLDLVNPKIRKVALRKCVQIGATQLAGNALLYYVANKTLPCAIFFPSQKLAQQFAERVIHPAIETTEALKEFLTDDLDDLKKTDWTFKSCNVKAIGGGSSSSLSSNNIALAIVDEANKYAAFTSNGEAKEADALDLIEDRTVSFKETQDDKIFVTSTPTISHSCLISAEVEKGSNSYWHIPCPHCQTFQRLEFANIIFSHCKAESGEYNLDRVRLESFYRCPHCGGKITDADKPALLNAGKWVATNPDAPRDVRSYSISGLYSLSFTFGEIARIFLTAKNSRSGLMNFYNSVLGEPFTPQAATVSDKSIETLIERSPQYTRGELPLKPKAIILSADTQKIDIVWMITAILENGASAILDYGYSPTFEDLNILLSNQYRVKGGGSELYGLYGGIQDAAGTQTAAVYENYSNSGHRIVPCYGKTEGHKLFAPIRISSVTDKKGVSVPIIHVNDKTFSDLLLFQALKPNGGETLYLPQDSCDTLKAQLTSVSIVEKKNKKGFVIQDYVSKRDNHLFDCLKYYYALKYHLAPQLDELPEEESGEETEVIAAESEYSAW